MKFVKYHALGNDYIVIHPSEQSGWINPVDITPEQVRRICDRHYGVGSDGLLFGPLAAASALPGRDFCLRLFNPDGSEFEKSGNGLRIFARYLWDSGLVKEGSFTVSTPGGLVSCRIHPGGRMVTVEMGRVSFRSLDIPVLGPDREVLDEKLSLQGSEFHYCAATIGNPHCVVLSVEISAAEARRWGPVIEQQARFPNRTNVQFMKVIDRSNIQIEIWERGAGYTLASGSSSCAAAAVAHRLGYCGREIAVHMPGGRLEVALTPDFLATLTGPVVRICTGDLEPDP